MLKYLKIKNFAVIDSLEVEFGEGLQIITGETGAGKSILVGAIELLLGGRADSEKIRSGCEYLEIEAVVDIDHHPGIQQRLSQYGIAMEESGLIIRRIFYRNSKNRI
ncbi:MAG: AAA family ATPase, partial [Syntrophales bacterium LBB04]|nr:AAA family ATPase [Syntrophales bacterium LBB04]